MLRRPLSLEQLHGLRTAGELRNLASVELVAGVLLASPLPSPGVVAHVADLAVALDRALPDHRVAVREPFAIGPHDLIRPELALVRPVWGADGIGRPLGSHDGFWPASALALAVFVGDAESPLRWRAQRCARAGVPEAWTVALIDATASRWRYARDGRYQRRDPLLLDEAVAPEADPSARVVPWPRPGVG